MNVTDAATALINVTRTEANNSSTSKQNPVELGLYVTLEICIVVLAFSFNVLVIAALRKFHSLRTPTNHFVASLAVADIAVATFAIPSAILLRFGVSVNHDACDDITDGPSVSEGVCLLIISSVVFLTQVSIFSLVLIAIDRFIAINYPFKYKQFMTTTKTRVSIVAAWIFGGLISIVPELGWNEWAGMQPCDKNQCAFEQVISMEYMVYFNFFGCVLTPLIAMGVMYLFIFRSAKKQLRKIYFDVKDLDISRSTEVLDQIKHATTTTLSELADGIYSVKKKRAKKQSRANSATLHTEGIDELAGKSCGKNSRGCSSILGPEIDENIPEEAVNRGSNLKSTVEKDGETTPPFSNVDINDKSLLEKQNSCPELKSKVQTVSEEGGEKLDPDVDKEKSIHNGKDLSHFEQGQEKEHLRLPVVENPRDQSKIATCKTTTPLDGVTNGDAALKTSRLSVNAAEREMWSIADNNNASVQNSRRKMKRKSQLLKKEFRAARSLATVVGIFALCWLPLHILNCITLFCPSCHQPHWLKDLAILLSHANSLLNPIIYAYKLRDFRDAFRKLLSTFCPSKDDSFCCFLSSRVLESHDVTSDDKSASGDNSTGKNMQEAPVFRKHGPNRRKSNMSNSNINGIDRRDSGPHQAVPEITVNSASYADLAENLHSDNVPSNNFECCSDQNHAKDQPLLKVITPFEQGLINSSESVV